eukprot:scaffold552_cov526-Prasinococcus_capsulatus_cf.AAC.22
MWLWVGGTLTHRLPRWKCPGSASAQHSGSHSRTRCRPVEEQHGGSDFSETGVGGQPPLPASCRPMRDGPSPEQVPVRNSCHRTLRPTHGRALHARPPKRVCHPRRSHVPRPVGMGTSQPVGRRRLSCLGRGSCETPLPSQLVPVGSGTRGPLGRLGPGAPVALRRASPRRALAAGATPAATGPPTGGETDWLTGPPQVRSVAGKIHASGCLVPAVNALLCGKCTGRRPLDPGSPTIDTGISVCRLRAAMDVYDPRWGPPGRTPLPNWFAAPNVRALASRKSPVMQQVPSASAYRSRRSTETETSWLQRNPCGVPTYIDVW